MKVVAGMLTHNAVRYGRMLVAVDLADHLGEELSTWGNGSARFAKSLDVDGRGLTSTATGTMVAGTGDATPVPEQR